MQFSINDVVFALRVYFLVPHLLVFGSVTLDSIHLAFLISGTALLNFYILLNSLSSHFVNNQAVG